ncbi:MAG: phosphogluconate dehydratase [Burkholderiales bacterium]|nr:phosphogluconate dehydratase [Burkholderiales bacterium]
MPTVALHPVLARVTENIVQRSAGLRSAYLAALEQTASRPRGADRLGCANLAHTWAATPAQARLKIIAEKPLNIAVITAFNDMLSAHQPYETYPALIKAHALHLGANVQVAGGVPAMCDGITQGYAGMELSLFSRDNIAMATAVGLSHDVFDAVLLLGVCDKIVPGLLIGALHFGHLPCVFVPAGPMSTGLSNKAKSEVRNRFAQGLADKAELMAAETAAYHSAGTCTFYGTANSNQMLLEAMGLHIPDSAFHAPDSPQRKVFIEQAVESVIQQCKPDEFTPIGRLVDERCIVNAMVALIATGGSTNHLIHWVAVARAAGIVINWNDFDDLSAAVPLLARVYPNGSADVNAFQAAGGPQWVLAQLLEAGYLHGDVRTVTGLSLREAAAPWLRPSGDLDVLRPADAPFSATGGLRLLQGVVGRAVMKVSAVAPQHQVVRAPARVFDTQEAVAVSFKSGALDKDVVVVVRGQGPKANGMPELHKLTPLLSVLQDKGHQVALLTDGRMSGASGKVPAAIHVCPEALNGGVIGLIRDGDWVLVDAQAGVLGLEVSQSELDERKSQAVYNTVSDSTLGRALFGNFRMNVRSAEEGAVTWL